MTPEATKMVPAGGYVIEALPRRNQEPHVEFGNYWGE